MSGDADETAWAQWLRAATAGDAAAYRRFLGATTPRLRAVIMRGCTRAGLSASDGEDILQETLLALHLKRTSWDPDRPVGPWMAAIARNKLADALRRRGNRTTVPIDDLGDVLEAPREPDRLERRDLERAMEKLPERSRTIVRALAIDDADVGETARSLAMTEGAVRVALHRAIKSLAALLRDPPSSTPQPRNR